MGTQMKTPQKVPTVAAKTAEAAPAKAAPAPSNAAAQGALASGQTAYTQVMDSFKQGIPDVGALYDLINKLSPAEKETIAKNAGFMAQIDARTSTGDLGIAIYGALGMADGEGEEGAALGDGPAPAAAAPAKPAAAVS